jgi:hypothetical protein
MSELENNDFENSIKTTLNNVLEEHLEENNGLMPDLTNVNFDEVEEKEVETDSDDIEEIENDLDDIEEEEHVNETDLYKEKYYLEKKKRKSVLADRQKLEQENYQLKNALDGTIDSNTKLYARDLYNDLEKAKSLKKQALLGDDPDLLLEADEIHQKLLHKVNEFESYVSSRTPDASNEEIELEENYEEKVKLSNAQEWLNERPELVEGSYNFNPKIQKELGTFIEQFDRELKRNGREDEILSDAYLDVLDEFVDSVKINRPKDGYTTSNVGGVRNNFSNGSQTSTRFVMSTFDKEMAKSMNITPEQYIAYNINKVK